MGRDTNREETPELGARLRTYLEELGRIGERAFRQKYPEPVLLRVSIAPSVPPREFNTAVAPPSERGARLLGTALSFDTEVVHVAKRPDSAFPDRIGVGRTANTDVCLPLPNVSKYHAYFHRDESGRYRLTDAGSTNGTSLQRRRLEPKETVELSEGCDIEFGPHRFRFVSSEGFFRLLGMLGPAT